MKYLVALVMTLCALPVLGAQQLSTKSKTITWSWTQVGSNAPACTAPTDAGCGINYTFTLTDPTGKVGTPVSVNWPATSYLYAPGGFLFCGTWKGSLTLTYQDVNAVKQTTTAITGSAVVDCPLVISPPSGLVGTPGP